MLTSRKKRPLIREEGIFRDARLLIIATEGSVTEKLYFEQFGDSRVQVHVIESADGRSSPDHVLENLDKFAAHFEIGSDDELWVVIDRDRWKARSLKAVASSCLAKRYNLAVSNPCFEIWLAYHFDSKLPQKINCRSLVAYLKAELGKYSKNSYDGKNLVARVDSAMLRAKSGDKDENSRWPNDVGTRVYKVMESLRKL